VKIKGREGAKKTKKTINDGFKYLCVAGKCEMMVFCFGESERDNF